VVVVGVRAQVARGHHTRPLLPDEPEPARPFDAQAGQGLLGLLGVHRVAEGEQPDQRGQRCARRGRDPLRGQHLLAGQGRARQRAEQLLDRVDRVCRVLEVCAQPRDAVRVDHGGRAAHAASLGCRPHRVAHPIQRRRHPKASGRRHPEG